MISLGLLLILLQMGSTDAQAPETPTNVILTQLSENILQLKWSAPQADDPLVTNYILTLTDEAGTEKNYLISGDAESYTINNLVPLVPYTIAFSALNDDGASNAAQAQITLVKGPNPPTNVYLKPKSANLYNLVWDAPVGPYDHLLLRYGPADDLEDFQEFEIEKNQTSYDMKNLTQNVRYAVQFYSLKNGVSSVAATIALDSGQRPDPPTAVNVQSFGTTVDLTWSGPDGEVDGYAVAYYPTDGSEDPVTVYFDEDETSATISDLKESQDYTFNVYSVKNKVPSPGVGVQVTIPSPADRPSPPGFLDYVRTSSTGYKIFWEENLNSDVDSFLLQYRPVDGSVGVQEISVPATEVGVTLEDLQADVGYEFSIFSVADNVLSEPVTVDSAPEPPHELSFESITETSLNVFWLPSDDLSVDSYYLKYSEVNANTEAVSVTAPSTARNVLIEDIVPGSEYELSLSSVSEGIKSQPLTLLTGNLPASNPCVNSPCSNAGSCQQIGTSADFICICKSGFQGNRCEEDIDECDSLPCQNNGICQDLVNGYNCICISGFIGNNCETDIDECASTPCQNGAACVDDINSYRCTCLPGFEGFTCDIDIDECASSPCQNGGVCSDLTGVYTCTCQDGFTGANCGTNTHECDSNPCVNGGTCLDHINHYSCTCLPGYAGVNCEIVSDINECASAPCSNGAACINLIDRFLCECSAGYTGVFCEIDINECSSSPCRNGGTCEDRINSYVCNCNQDYRDPTCSVASSVPITFGEITPSSIEFIWFDSSSDVAYYSLEVTAEDGSVQTMLIPFTSTSHVVENLQSGALYDFVFSVINNYGKFQIAEFSQNTVVDISICDSTPCQNGGRCIEDLNGYNCACLDGYQGINCSQLILTVSDVTASSITFTWPVASSEKEGYIITLKDASGGVFSKSYFVPISHIKGSHYELTFNNLDPNGDYTANVMLRTSGEEGSIIKVRTTAPCSSSPCKNQAVCQDSVSGFLCVCWPGWYGTFCEREVVNLPCSSSPCQNGATCVNNGVDFTCTCPVNFLGTLCSQPLILSACDSNPCQNGANCYNFNLGFYCQCQSGWQGTTCTLRISTTLCDNRPCQNGGTCSSIGNTILCSCPSGWEGTLCDTDINECISQPCLNGGTCTNNIDAFRCLCPVGFSGFTCGVQLTCFSNPCMNGGTCIELSGAYSCQCIVGYEGTNCQSSLCTDTLCMNGGTCVIQANVAVCLCLPEFTGTLCEVNINPCMSQPCQNGGICFDRVVSFFCQCPDGFIGSTCQLTDWCANNPCLNGGTCYRSGNFYKCICQVGYQGQTCAEITMDCRNNPCLNGGTCTTTSGSVSCRCLSGYSGTYCEAVSSACISSPCFNGALCITTNTGFTCQCSVGFSGTLCEVVASRCGSSPCQNGGQCTELITGYLCSCPSGYSGVNCQIIEGCTLNTCQNGGTCTQLTSGFLCTCLAHFAGTNCEVPVNHNYCNNIPCNNGAACRNDMFDPKGYVCDCTTGFTGETCATQINGNSVNSVSLMDECSSSPCQNGGTCQDVINGYVCQCPSGFTGYNCQSQLLFVGKRSALMTDNKQMRAPYSDPREKIGSYLLIFIALILTCTVLYSIIVWSK